jgi:hypothetical protein
MDKKRANAIALDMLLGALFGENREAEAAWKKQHESLSLAQQVEQAKKECNL